MWQWAFGYHRPGGWNHEDRTNLQDVRIAELLKGYDDATTSYENATDLLVVERVEASQSGDMTISLSGGYRLLLFPTSVFVEAWRLFRPGDTSTHLVVGDRFSADSLLAEYSANSVSDDPHHQAAFCYLRSKTLEDQGNVTGAIEQLNRAIELHPKFAPAYFSRAHLYHSLDDPKRGLTDVNEAIHLSGESYEGYTLRGNLRITLEDLDGAIDDFTKALALFPKGSRA